MELVTDEQYPREAKWSSFEPPTLHDEIVNGLYFSLTGLVEAHHRCATSRMDARKSWAAAVEGMWWISSIDDVLYAEFGAPYAKAREEDTYGKTVHGFRWLRHRHTHEFVSTAQGAHAENFYVPKEKLGLFFISPSICWKDSSEIFNMRDKVPNWRRTYDENIGGKPIEFTLVQAIIWFQRIFSASGLERPDSPVDPSILS